MSKPWPYRALLRMLPPNFRARHRAAIDEALAAAWNESGAASPAWRVWLRASLDLLTGLPPAWISTVQRGFPTRRTDRHVDEATSMDGWLQDIRYGARGLMRAPALTLLCTAAIGLGMGANTAVFTLVNEILLRPLPVREPAQLVDVHLDQPGANSFLGFSFPEYEDYRSRRKSLEGLVAHSGIGLRLGDQVGGDRIRGQLNSADYFEVLGVTPARGRAFTAREAETEGGGNVAVVSHGFWQRRFGGSDDLIGSDIEFNGIDFTVVGILPAGFTGRFIGFPSEVWLPLAMMDRLRPGTELRSRGEQALEMFGRLRAEDSIAAASDELNAIAAQLEREHPDMNRNRRVALSAFSGLDQGMPRKPITGLTRLETAPATLQRLVAEHLARADATLQVPTVERLSELIEIFLLPQRLASRVAGALGALGFLLAVAGIYGIVSYTLGQRRRELGIRMALGGRPADVRSLMLKFGLRIVVAGSAAGLAVSALLGPLLRDFLVGVAPTDPLTMLTVVASLGASALLAAYVPARRAAAIDPATTLRYDA